MSLTTSGYTTMGHWTPVPPGATHKLNAREALLREYRYSFGGADFVAEVPEAHVEYDGSPHGGRLIHAELLRQATTAYAHVAHQVPLGWAFIMRGMSIEQRDLFRPGLIEVAVTAQDVLAPRGVLRSLRSEVAFRQQGVVVGRGWGELQVVSPAIYERIRGHVRPRVEASTLGAWPVRIEPTGKRTWTLEFNPQNRFFFDHEVDHVPGMVMFAGLSYVIDDIAHQPAAISFQGQFSRYVELDEPMCIELVDDEVTLSDGRRLLLALSGANRAIVCEAQVLVSTRGPE
ncbi:AfsA-related hotdog domain-containing protein [Microbacterium sp. NPDC058389]|uniref:AfsA-related hotdog domain-containing protein n=1 Tax=Microbacterium sp. NPDC058389 TaxID=3346475 RepID=UPI00364F1C91